MQRTVGIDLPGLDHQCLQDDALVDGFRPGHLDRTDAGARTGVSGERDGHGARRIFLRRRESARDVRECVPAIAEQRLEHRHRCLERDPIEGIARL